MDTIYALATARGRAGVAVIRVSGPRAHDAVSILCGDLPAARRPSVRLIVDNGVVLDEALVLVFDAGASFTRERVAELHVHGSSAVVRAVLRALSQIPGLRQAEPGEFTRRALESGRLDLAQVEGLADLIDAETEAQRLQAIRIFRGAIADEVNVWRDRLLHAMALVEATIDFSEEDLPAGLLTEVQALLGDVRSALTKQLAGYGTAERLRTGFEVALVGAPNVGKSTLLNALARREAALTSPIAGTTRDVIEVRMDVAGLPVTLLDTAGIRETTDPLEAAGIERTRYRAADADLRIFLITDPSEALRLVPMPDDLLVVAKSDLFEGSTDLLTISGRTGAGVDVLLDRIASCLSERFSGAGIVVHERHRLAVSAALLHLELALDGLANGENTEICADEIRQSVRALESLIGKVDTEELLGHIFGRFCIGK